jgi:hypothetical protein
MKKFIISEEEKNRILGMHQDATKRHYLKEQESRPSQTFSPENVKKIYDTANQLFNRGDKKGFFTIDTLPTHMFQLTSENSESLSLSSTPLEVWVGVPLVPLEVRKHGDLSIATGTRVGESSKLIHTFDNVNSNVMAAIQKEPEAIKAAKDFGDAFGSFLPKDATSKVLKNTYKTMTEQNKNNFMAFLQRTNPELNTYKQKIESTLGLA